MDSFLRPAEGKRGVQVQVTDEYARAHRLGGSVPGRAALLMADGVPVIARGLVSKSGAGHDSQIRGQRLLHDDQGDAWRSWFVAAGIDGFEIARHSYLNDWPLVISAALQGQGVALVASAFVERELRTGRLTRLGTTRAEFGKYCLLESKDRATAKVRGAFHRWIENELGEQRSPEAAQPASRP